MGFSITPATETPEPKPRRGFVSVGIDIGKVVDPTAVVISEGFPGEGEDQETFEVRSIRRLKLGTSYTEVTSTLVGIVEGLRRLRGDGETPTVVLDGTGVGEPISDQIRAALRGQRVRITSVTFSPGERFKGERWDARVSVGKDWLVARLQVLLENRRIKLPKTEMAREVANELQTFEIRTVNGHEVSGAFKVGAHDDLVVALALACLPPRVSVLEYRDMLSV